MEWLDRLAQAFELDAPTNREIAAVLRMSETTVRVHLHRAVAALRKRLGPGRRPG